MTEAKKPAKAKKEAKPKIAKVAKEPKAKIVRERQHGFTRPTAGSKTGVVWDVADSISQKMRRPALRNEVLDDLEKQKDPPSAATAATQYSRWCGFHNVTAELRKFKATERKERDAKAKQEKADKKADAEKAKAEKEAAKKAKEDQKKAA